MPSESADLYQSCARDLTDQLERTFGALEPLQTSFGALIEQVGEPSLEVGDLAGVDAAIDGVLDTAPGLLGAGVVVRPGALRDAELCLEWRQRQRDGSIAPLVLDVEAGDDAYDYPNMEWFRIPADEGRRMVSGPYFDYQGNEKFTLTYAVPVTVAGEFLGIAGADQTVTDLESVALPVLRRIPHPAALLNHERRILTANAPELVTGQRLPIEKVEAAQRFPVAEDVGWTLAVLEGS